MSTSTYAQRLPNDNELTVAPNLVDTDVTNDLKSLSDYTTLRQIFPSEVVSDGEIQAAIDYRNAFKQSDVITALCGFYNNAVNTYFRQADFPLESILYWYQKLSYSNKEITSYKSKTEYYSQNLLTNQLPGASLFSQNAFNNSTFNQQEGYFDNISDTIGTIVNSKYIQLDTTLPIFDINQDYYGVPVPYSASIDNKLSATARNLAYNLSRKNTVVMRRNLMGIAYTTPILQQNMAADATTSHGLNLINDLPTFVNINKQLDAFKSTLAGVFKQAKLFGFIQYLSNIGNQTALNLRDIFPIQPSDKDFTIVTSEESAAASQEIAAQEAADAQAAYALEHTAYLQSQQGGILSAAIYDPTTGETTYTTTANSAPPTSVYLGADADPELVKKQLGLSSKVDAQNAIIAYNTAYNEALKQGATDAQARQVASAICGNIAQESSFRTNLSHDQGIGYGLLGENQDILQRMRAYAVSKGESPNNVSAQTQIEALFREPAFYKRGGYSGMINAPDVSTAAVGFAKSYLKPTAATANYQARSNNAIAIQGSFTPAIPPKA